MCNSVVEFVARKIYLDCSRHINQISSIQRISQRHVSNNLLKHITRISPFDIQNKYGDVHRYM
ncbi:hypothetical protein PVAP13_3NG037490 [Panicum virgatum]|uniref:Uncharacterized protein n=1 Tax=Panicum virgatum TaxID=38727 RepID=A0A8T0U288_PANVG|nr:hypothetical protein PVAP13_3NG037490 [Panicum virgatum]